jgi:hypothetical protein
MIIIVVTLVKCHHVSIFLFAVLDELVNKSDPCFWMRLRLASGEMIRRNFACEESLPTLRCCRL